MPEIPVQELQGMREEQRQALRQALDGSWDYLKQMLADVLC